MTATEQESRTVDAEKNPALLRPLIADLKAHKDKQLSSLTTKVNEAQAELAKLQSEHDAYVSRVASAQEAILTVCKRSDLDANKELPGIVAESFKTERQKAVEQAQAEKDEAERKLANLKA